MPRSRQQPDSRGGARMSLAARIRQARQRHGVAVRSGLVFVFSLVALQTPLVLLGPRFWELPNAWTARLTAMSLSLLGASARAEGPSVQSSVLSFEVIGECTGIYPILIYASAVLAFPVRWRYKLAGLAAGIPCLVLVNLVRLTSLCYIGRWWPEKLDVAHIVVWQSLIIFFTILAWFVWVGVVVRHHDSTFS